MKIYHRRFVNSIYDKLREHSQFIHVVIGPRQVGKTTGIQQLLAQFPHGSSSYVSADGELLRPSSWFLDQWLMAKSNPKIALLVIDEIQKVENWSEIVKQIWDEQSTTTQKHHKRIKLVLLGSSSMNIQKGLSESLAGRYMLHPVNHWLFHETQQAFGLNLEQYLTFGGYPASYALIKNKNLWLDYIQQSIIHPVLGKDILSLARVKSPSLFKQCFDIACSYAVQEISYTKLLGQLQEKGNTELVKHYLELFEGAFLLRTLQKFSNRRTLVRSSSPKILPLCPALYTTTLGATLNTTELGRSFELFIGAYLSTLPGELYYWRHKNHEVDYVLTHGKNIYAIEVKFGKSSGAKGLEKFKQEFPSAELLLITKENYGDVFRELTKYLS